MLDLVLALAIATSPTLFLEREVLRAADARCQLLQPGARAALAAGARQAGAALQRGGRSYREIDVLSGKAQAAAAGMACNAPPLQEAAQRAQAAYAGWASQPSIEFPGRSRVWSARRFADGLGWRLRQSAGSAHFGVHQAEGIASLASAAPPGPWIGATLWMRDNARDAGLRGSATRLTAPARSSAIAFLAQARTVDDGVTYFRFADAAAEKISALHPDEAIEIEYLARGDTPPLRLLFEAGDFAAALIFLKAADRASDRASDRVSRTANGR